MAWTVQKTWVVGAILPAADLNTYVRDDSTYLWNILNGVTAQDIVLGTSSVLKISNGSGTVILSATGAVLLAIDHGIVVTGDVSATTATISGLINGGKFPLPFALFTFSASSDSTGRVDLVFGGTAHPGGNCAIMAQCKLSSTDGASNNCNWSTSWSSGDALVENSQNACVPMIGDGTALNGTVISTNGANAVNWNGVGIAIQLTP